MLSGLLPINTDLFIYLLIFYIFQMISLSVVIPCHNQAANIRQLLRSLEQQTLPPSRFEVIVSDDGSTDDTPEVLKNYRAAFAFQGLLSPINQGPSVARNRAISAAAAQYIVLLDGDMTVHPLLLETYQQRLTQSPTTILIGSVEPAPGENKNSLAWYRVRRGAYKLKPDQPIPPRYFRSQNAALSAEWFKRTGPFNEAYREPGGEDLELGYRLSKAGGHFAVAPKALAFHHHPLSLSGHLDKTTRYAKGNLKRLLHDCPNHGAIGYLSVFRSPNPLLQLSLSLLFLSGFTPLVSLLAKRAGVGPFSAWLYDYLTYSTLYRALREAS